MEGCVMGGGGGSDSEAYVHVGLQWLCHQAVPYSCSTASDCHITGINTRLLGIHNSQEHDITNLCIYILHLLSTYRINKL